MRDMKFRVWDDGNNKWVEDWQLTQLLWRADGKLMWWPTSMYARIAKGYTIEWSTSLNDKNGKEIYEGDIVVHHHKYGDHAQRVEWKELAGEQEDWIGFNLEADISTHGKVIGNVHEHPQLLDGK